MARVIEIDPQRPDPGVITEAVRVLERGGLVAFPTETVYGLGARGLHPDDVAKIFAAKRRPPGHPVILHVDSVAMARTIAAGFGDVASRFAEAFWPGPLTLVVPRARCVPDVVTGGLDAVGIRAPSHAVALALVHALGEPIAAPSANAHTHVSPTSAAHVVRSLGDRVDLVLDAGPCQLGIESTVLALGDPPRVLRPGSVSLERLRSIEPTVVHGSEAIEGDGPRAAPGMAAKHYAPRTNVVLVRADELAETVSRSPAKRIAAIVVSEGARLAARECSLVVVLPAEPAGYAHDVFAALHEVDAAAVDLLVIEQVPDDPAWLAIADRLSRASRA